MLALFPGVLSLDSSQRFLKLLSFLLLLGHHPHLPTLTVSSSYHGFLYLLFLHTAVQYRMNANFVLEVDTRLTGDVTIGRYSISTHGLRGFLASSGQHRSPRIDEASCLM